MDGTGEDKKEAEELERLLKTAETRVPSIKDLEEAHAASQRVHERNHAADIRLGKRAYATDTLR